MSAIMFCTVAGLVLGRFLTGTAMSILWLFVASTLVGWIITRYESRHAGAIAKMVVFCVAVLLSSSFMAEIVHMANHGMYEQAIGELPEVLVFGFFIPATSMTAVYLIILFKKQ